MNTLIWNKIAAALLLALLLYKGIEIYAEGAFEVAEPETKAYVVEGLELAAPEVVVAAPQPAPEEDVMALLATASAEQGKRIFRRCQACHDASQDGGHKIGPNLFAVIGAAVARHDDYRYSKALASHGGTWDFALMNDWLASPAGAIAGNKMIFGGMPRAGDRAALIAYLNSASNSPLALPAPVPAPEQAEEAPRSPAATLEDVMADDATAPVTAQMEDGGETAAEDSEQDAVPSREESAGESGEENAVEDSEAEEGGG